MPLSDYSDQQLLEELLQRAAKRDGLGLEGHQDGNMAQVSYREVVPVEGQPVPDGCEFRGGSHEWERECFIRFTQDDVKLHNGGVIQWRVPAGQ